MCELIISHIQPFFVFLLQKDFSSSKRFWDLSRASFRSFSLFFWIIFIKYFYIYIQKTCKKFLVVILIFFKGCNKPSQLFLEKYQFFNQNKQ